MKFILEDLHKRKQIVSLNKQK